MQRSTGDYRYSSAPATRCIDHDDDRHDARTVTVWFSVHGTGSLTEAIAVPAEVPGVLSVSGDDATTLAV